MTTRRVLATALILTGLVLTGCAGGSDDSADRSSGDGGGANALEAADSSTGEALAAGAEVAGVRREVIYTANLVVRVDDAEAASESARDLVTEVGGFVSQQSADLEGTSHVSITLRVPADRFDGLVDELIGLGEVLRRDLESADVTDQVVDLERRISNARVSADRLRELLAQADGIPNVLAIEAELTKRETEIEVMSGQLQVVRDRVDLSTLTVRFTEERPSDPEVNDDLPGFVRSFKAGLVAVANIGLGALAVIGFVLPFVPFVLVGWFGWRWYRKRHPRSETPRRSGSAPMPGWPTQTPQPTPSAPVHPTAPPPPPAATETWSPKPADDPDADSGSEP